MTDISHFTLNDVWRSCLGNNMGRLGPLPVTERTEGREKGQETGKRGKFLSRKKEWKGC